MKKISLLAKFISCCCLVCVVSCGESSSEPVGIQALAASSNSANNPNNPNNEKVEIRSQATHNPNKYQKPGAPLRLTSNSHFTMNTNEQKTIQVEIEALNKKGSAKIRLSNDKGLYLSTDSLTHQFETNGSQTYTFPIDIQTLDEGRFAIHLMTEFRDQSSQNDQYSTRALAIVIDVKDPSVEAQQEKTRIDKNKESIDKIVLPAQETIINH